MKHTPAQVIIDLAEYQELQALKVKQDQADKAEDELLSHLVQAMLHPERSQHNPDGTMVYTTRLFQFAIKGSKFGGYKVQAFKREVDK